MQSPRGDVPDVEGQLIEIVLDGHLTVEKVREALGGVDADTLARGDARLYVDVLEMTGYDSAAREAFVQWHKEHRTLIRKEAILTRNALYRMVISAMSMATTVQMKAFVDPDTAMRWLIR